MNSTIDIHKLDRQARNKLSQEAALPDPNLRRLVGHANLLDNLFVTLSAEESDEDEETGENEGENERLLADDSDSESDYSDGSSEDSDSDGWDEPLRPDSREDAETETTVGTKEVCKGYGSFEMQSYSRTVTPEGKRPEAINLKSPSSTRVSVAEDSMDTEILYDSPRPLVSNRRHCLLAVYALTNQKGNFARILSLCRFRADGSFLRLVRFLEICQI